MRNELGQFKSAAVKNADGSEETGRQFAGEGSFLSLIGSALAVASGGSWGNPMGFPAYGSLYYPSDGTYRWMLKHPVLRLVRSIAVGSIVSSSWEYEKAYDSVPDEQVELASAVMNPIRSRLVNDFFIRGRDHGWAGGEIVWDNAKVAGKDRTYICHVKPLLQESTEIMLDEHGNPNQLKNNVPVGDEPSAFLPMPFKAWLYTYDSESGYRYGRSWLENVRETAWKDWLDCAQQLVKLSSKITGIVTVVTSPSGTFPTGRVIDGKQETVSYKENAEAVIKGLASGAAGAWMPALGISVDPRGNVEANKVLSQLAGKPLINVDTKDFGSQAPAIMGILERMRHDEELMFMGGLRPSRVGLEGKHGTMAEAEVHTDTGTMNSENDDKDFARQCQPLIDAQLAVSFSEKARGNVRIKCPSLVDRKTAVIKALLLSGMNVPAIAAEIISLLDVVGSLKLLGLNTTRDFDPSLIRKFIEAQSQKSPEKPAGNVEPQGGRPTEKK